MSKVYVLYSGKPTYKRVLIRRVSWWRVLGLRFYFRSNFKSSTFCFWNVQFLIVGTEKFNGSVEFRFLNHVLEIGW